MERDVINMVQPVTNVSHSQQRYTSGVLEMSTVSAQIGCRSPRVLTDDALGVVHLARMGSCGLTAATPDLGPDAISRT